MPIDTVPSFLQALRQCKALTIAQLDELSRNVGAFPNARAMAGELIKAAWLTPFQINSIFQGRATEMLVGPYTLVERLGEGGVGHVFKARHVYMQRFVALKFLKADLVTNQEVLGRFYREIQAVSQLVHPNVVLAHDAGPAGNSHFMAMEYVEGINLEKLVQQSGPLSIEQACDYVRQTALGLQHIHERNLIHRDVKPGNLLVTQIENSDRPGMAGSLSGVSVGQSFPYGLIKILDLGLVRFDDLDDVESNDPLTQAGAGGIRGSADYLSPEQAVDFHTADIRADIYSLGCTFYYLLSGKPPFEGGSLAQKLMKHQRASPPPLEKHRQNLPRRLSQIVSKMMAKRPADRYRYPAEVAAAIVAIGHQRSWLGIWR